MIDRFIKLLVILLAVLLLSLMLIAITNDTQAQECGSSAPIRVGDTARCAGVVFPQSWAFQCVNCMDVDLPMYKTKHELCSMLSLRNESAWKAKEASYKAQLIELEKLTRESAGIESPWYDNKILWFTLGAVTAGSLIWVAR